MKENKYTSVEYITQKLKHRIEYINHVIEGIRLFGVKKYNDSLYELGIFKKTNSDTQIDKYEFSFFDEEDEKIVEFILDLVIKEWKEYNIKRENLFNLTKKLEHARARDMAITLIQNHTSISNTKIAEYFNRTRQVVFNVIKAHKEKKLNKNKHSLYFERYNRLTKAILIKEKEYGKNDIGVYVIEKSKPKVVKLLKTVYQFSSDGKFMKKWENAKIASRSFALNPSNIIYCCEKKLKTSGGYIWKYKRF